jgi:hypothetical protein
VGGITFDWSIRLDSLLVVITMIGGMGAIWGALRADLLTLTDKVRHIEGSMGEQRDALITIARQDERLKDIDRRLNVLER